MIKYSYTWVYVRIGVFHAKTTRSCNHPVIGQIITVYSQSGNPTTVRVTDIIEKKLNKFTRQTTWLVSVER